MERSRKTALFSMRIFTFLFGCSSLAPSAASAQARNPFDVGISEGGGVPGSSLAKWIWAQQIAFERMLADAVSAVQADYLALWPLLSIAFAYGVFHAAGPGHGKAVVASYVVANERALKRGIAISFLAAILQAVVAVAIVSVLAVVLNATAARMKSVAGIVEAGSYFAIAALGLWLVWRKGRLLLQSWWKPAESSAASHHHQHGDHGHVHGPDCGHFHAPDPSTLGDGFSRGVAVATVFAAGLRPCSGAILVLVFALAQGIFLAGIAATFAMSIGTALTTGSLAAVAVLGKSLAERYLARAGSDIAGNILRLAEFLAALFILLLGILLFAGAIS